MSKTLLVKFSIPAMFCMLFSIPSYALTLPSSTPEPVKKESTSVAPPSQVSVKDFLALSPKKFREMTGHKMSLSQKIGLKIAQARVKREIKTNPNVSVANVNDLVNSSDFNLGGFVMGLLLSVVGVLIAYLIDDRDVIKWAWIGFGIGFVVFLLFLIL